MFLIRCDDAMMGRGCFDVCMDGHDGLDTLVRVGADFVTSWRSDGGSFTRCTLDHLTSTTNPKKAFWQDMYLISSLPHTIQSLKHHCACLLPASSGLLYLRPSLWYSYILLYLYIQTTPCDYSSQKQEQSHTPHEHHAPHTFPNRPCTSRRSTARHIDIERTAASAIIEDSLLCRCLFRRAR